MTKKKFKKLYFAKKNLLLKKKTASLTPISNLGSASIRLHIKKTFSNKKKVFHHLGNMYLYWVLSISSFRAGWFSTVCAQTVSNWFLLILQIAKLTNQKEKWLFPLSRFLDQMFLFPFI